MILAGDIGGTKTHLALFDADLRQVLRSEFPSREHPDLSGILRAFLDGPGSGRRVTRACLGVAGPVRGATVRTTNLPWELDARDLARALEIPEVWLINDLEANAWGIAALRSQEMTVLSAGAADAAGNAALISAGTGLGEAGLHWDGATHRPFACEGGHASFAPRDALETELLIWLMRRFDHVSWERVVSGPGLLLLYEFLRDTARGEEPPWLREEIRDADPAAAIARAALEGRSELCAQALRLFVTLYGAEAGNLALKIMATGGVFVGGGMAPKILQAMEGPHFLAAFVAKGRMRPLLESMPVKVILNDRAALLGAARFASLRLV